MSLRTRVSLLYRGRRQTLLEQPIEAMRRAGLEPVADSDSRFARAALGGDMIEAGFANTFRVFGTLIDTLWTAKRGEIDRPDVRLQFRFGRGEKGRFVVRSGGERGRRLAESLNRDPDLRRLIKEGELKLVIVEESAAGRRVQVQPMAGTITAMYFPPLPPYTIALHSNEADAQLELATRLLSFGERRRGDGKEPPRDG